MGSGRCIVTKTPQMPDERFTYRLLDNGSAEVTGLKQEYRVFIHEPGRRMELCIPDTIEGRPLGGVAGEAFKGCWPVQAVFIGHGVVSIGARAFAGCDRLEWVRIPESVTDIGEDALDVAAGAAVRRQGDWKHRLLEAEKERMGKGSYYLSGAAVKAVYSNALDDILRPASPDFFALTLEVEAGSYAQTYALEHGLGYTCGGFVDGDFAYRLHADGTADVTAYLGSGEAVEIPKSLNGHPVAGIAPRAFRDCRQIMGIVIGEGVMRIGRHAFENCCALEDAVLPEGLRRIDSSAFRGCKALRRIMIPQSVEEIGEFAFAACTGLEKAVIGGARQISMGAFEDCKALQHIEIREGVWAIMENAFRGCRKIKTVTGTEKLLFISRRAFDKRRRNKIVLRKDGQTSAEHRAESRRDVHE